MVDVPRLDHLWDGQKDHHNNEKVIWGICDRIPSTTPGAVPPKDAKDSSSDRSHSMHLETSSSVRP